MKILAVGAELFGADGWAEGRTDRRPDMTKLTVTFPSFSKAPKMDIVL